jgi:quercetin dioxygenase-like cupin family protein
MGLIVREKAIFLKNRSNSLDLELTPDCRFETVPVIGTGGSVKTEILLCVFRKERDMSSTNEGEGIFPKGEIVGGENFTGTAWLKMLVADDTTFDVQIYNVIFEPGARNNWHSHPGGQILLVTEGRGYYQEKGKVAQLLRSGDVVAIPPDVEHWHGAAPDSSFAHIGITTQAAKGAAQWRGPVMDTEYHEAVTE